MKTLLAILVALLLGACALTRESTPPDLLPEFDALERAEAEAAQTPDPADDAEVARRFAELEAKVLQRRAQPLNLLYPGLASMVTAMVPLLGKRGRKHYKSAVKSVSKGQLLVAAGDVMKALGAQHSSPESEAAATPKPPSQV